MDQNENAYFSISVDELPEKRKEFIDSSSKISLAHHSGCRNLSLALKHEAVEFLMHETLAVNHLPLEALPPVQTWTANCKRDRTTVVT